MAGKKRSRKQSFPDCTAKKPSKQLVPEKINNGNQCWLPEDMLFFFLQRLPGKSLTRFKCVSKSWNSMISEPTFMKNAHKLILWPSCSIHVMDYEVSTVKVRKLQPPLEWNQRIEAWASCNGLLWISGLGRRAEDLLWNPLTEECKILPFRRRSLGSFYTLASGMKSWRLDAFRLGYDQSAKDHKIVRFSMSTRSAIYSVRKASWTNIPMIRRICFRGKVGTSVSNSSVLYWFADYYCSVLQTQRDSCVICPSNNYDESAKKHEVVFGFDLIQESHVLLLPPPGINIRKTKLMDFRGCLCAIENKHSEKIEMWVLKEDKVKLNWINLMSIKHPVCEYGFLEPIYYTRDGEVLMNIIDWNSKRRTMFYAYNPTDDTYRTVKVRGFNYWAHEITYYAPAERNSKEDRVDKSEDGYTVLASHNVHQPWMLKVSPKEREPEWRQQQWHEKNEHILLHSVDMRRIRSTGESILSDDVTGTRLNDINVALNLKTIKKGVSMKRVGFRSDFQ